MKDKDFVAIAVHSPEFAHEEDVASLEAKMDDYKLSLPTYIDSGRVYFRELSARGWPEIMLIDRQGRLRYSYLGETHQGFSQAKAINKSLELLLTE